MYGGRKTKSQDRNSVCANDRSVYVYSYCYTTQNHRSPLILQLRNGKKVKICTGQGREVKCSGGETRELNEKCVKHGDEKGAQNIRGGDFRGLSGGRSESGGAIPLRQTGEGFSNVKECKNVKFADSIRPATIVWPQTLRTSQVRRWL